MVKWAMFAVVVFTRVLPVLPQTPVNVEDISLKDCRIWGVFHISLQDKYRLTLSQAREACRRLGTVLAMKAQVEHAYLQGYESCRYGWVDDGFLVIPRITPLQQCGRNKTGLLVWTQDYDKEFDAYCFRENDAKKRNVCEPLRILPTPFDTKTSSLEADPTTLPSITVVSTETVVSSETVSQPDPRATTPLQGARTLSTIPVEPTFSSSTPADRDKANAERGKPLASWVIYCILAMVLIVLVVFLVALTCYFKKHRHISFVTSERPKEAIEAEMLNSHQMENH